MGRMPTRFEEQYHCYSVAYADKSHLEVRKELTNSPTHSPRQGSMINSISLKSIGLFLSYSMGLY